MAKSYGWAGKILWVDLTDRKISKVPTSDFEPEKYIGGVGLNSKIFWELGSPKVDAFHPDSPLLISTGPLTGASGAFGRAEVCGIAPQSYPKELFTYSGFGGEFPSELKYAGYDGIVVLGKADRPVYLSIHDDDVEIKDARLLWGVDTFETQKALKEDYPAASVLTIGPAGENLSRIAIILNDTSNASGQGGFGGVMGSKNLKAVVVRGTGTIKIASRDDFLDLIAQVRKFGYWRAGGHQTWGRYIGHGGEIAQEMTEKYLKKFAGCYGCPYQCQGFYRIPGIGQGEQMCNEHWYAWCSGSSSEAMWEGNIMSQKLGINNLELTGTMNLINDGLRRRLFTKEDINLSFVPMIDFVLEEKYGGKEKHHRFLTELLGGIADGISLFHQGVARAAEQLGERAVMLYDTIYAGWGMRNHWIVGIPPALHWATDNRDPFDSAHDHVDCFGVNPTVTKYFGLRGGYRVPWLRNLYEEAEKETVWVQNHQCLKNSLPICEYASNPDMFFRPPVMDIRIFESKLLSVITGLDVDVDKLWEAGDRIWNLRRAIMVLRENRRRDDDTVSPRLFRQLAVGGYELEKPLDETEWEALKDRFYELRGWNVSNGWPTRDKLSQLGMKDVADTLSSAGKLG